MLGILKPQLKAIASIVSSGWLSSFRRASSTFRVRIYSMGDFPVTALTTSVNVFLLVPSAEIISSRLMSVLDRLSSESRYSCNRITRFCCSPEGANSSVAPAVLPESSGEDSDWRMFSNRDSSSANRSCSLIRSYNLRFLRAIVRL